MFWTVFMLNGSSAKYVLQRKPIFQKLEFYYFASYKSQGLELQ